MYVCIYACKRRQTSVLDILKCEGNDAVTNRTALGVSITSIDENR